VEVFQGTHGAVSTLAKRDREVLEGVTRAHELVEKSIKGRGVIVLA
jgi:hypothetical protein